jgi:hypothetical protein
MLAEAAGNRKLQLAPRADFVFEIFISIFVFKIRSRANALKQALGFGTKQHGLVWDDS